ncbi:MAG TPA: hypothetical protein PKV56_15010 [Burkholderiaceae bacterium]|nr:hypothetical protein [Burkholderiaceae bacterium]
MRHCDLLLSLLTPFWATCAIACAVPQDERPHSQRLADAPLAFIGTVTSMSGLRVTFAVHHAINGSPGPSTTVEVLSPSTCSIAFAVGQRWLYAGPATSQPSVLLLAKARSAPATDFGRLRRVDDARAQLPAAWQTCTANAQCEPVPIGCQRTSANAANVAAARAQSTKLLGDHRAMDCATPPVEIQPLASPQCVASRCGHWFLDLRLGV